MRRLSSALGLTAAILVVDAAQSHPQSGQALADAVRQNQVAVAQRLLEGGADVNAVDSTGRTALAITIGRPDAMMASLLR